MLKGSWTNAGTAMIVGLSLFAASCAGGSNAGTSGGSSSMIILSCSLSCNGGEAGSQISCGINQVAVNEAISVLFSQAVDLGSVNKNTFQVVDLATGKSPAGTFSIDPSNDHILIFRPQMTFDASGNPIFGFEDFKSYQIYLPGTNQDTGSAFITSVSGKPNIARMSCTVAANGILDPVPGPPTVTVKVDVVIQADPLIVEEQIASGGAFLHDVWHETEIRMEFDDIMNPATLVNPVTGESNTIKVFVDPDGNINDPTDRVLLFGDFTISIDENNLQTHVVFLPSTGLPSSGSGLLPRAIVVEFPTTIVDLGANPLTNAGDVIFAPEYVEFPPVVMPDGTGEQFLSTKYLDADKTGAAWGGGALIRGNSGGAGTLGPLNLTVEESPLVLDTDSQVWSNFDVIPSGSGSFPPSPTPPAATITDGVFEFSSIKIGPGAQLLFTGSQPARVYARGLAEVQGSGTINVGGDAPADAFKPTPGHDSSELDGGIGGPPGPGGGVGGSGGDRPNDTDPGLILLGGAGNPGAIVDGTIGGGVGGIGLGGGGGGAHWPTNIPSTKSDLAGFLPDTVCKIDMTAGPGGGGAYGTSGEEGIPVIVDPFLNPDPTGKIAPNTPGGDSASLGLTPEVRTLSPELGYLRGGGGGGGGAMSFLRSQTNGPAFGECLVGKEFSKYWTHSGAGGGGGGGALQLQAGKLVKVDGTIVSEGGDGASGQKAPSSFNREDQAAPGGGGAGGAVLIQSETVQIADTGGRIAVDGGSGGRGSGAFPGTYAGDGGAGLVRIEAGVAPDAAGEAKKITPYDATPGSVTGGATSSEILSVGAYAPIAVGPSGRSGAQSCWIIPEGNFFVLEFQEDDLTDPVNPDYGWDLDVVLNLGGFEPFSYRNGDDVDNPFGVAPEAILGSDLGGVTPAALVVRFQGVHSTKKIEDICSTDLSDPTGLVDPQSLTPWMRHPAELNSYWDLALPLQPEIAVKRRPNMIRYQIIFDGNAPLSGIIAGVTNVVIKGRPD